MRQISGCHWPQKAKQKTYKHSNRYCNSTYTPGQPLSNWHHLAQDLQQPSCTTDTFNDCMRNKAHSKQAPATKPALASFLTAKHHALLLRCFCHLLTGDVAVNEVHAKYDPRCGLRDSDCGTEPASKVCMLRRHTHTSAKRVLQLGMLLKQGGKQGCAPTYFCHEFACGLGLQFAAYWHTTMWPREHCGQHAVVLPPPPKLLLKLCLTILTGSSCPLPTREKLTESLPSCVLTAAVESSTDCGRWGETPSNAHCVPRAPGNGLCKTQSVCDAIKCVLRLN